MSMTDSEFLVEGKLIGAELEALYGWFLIAKPRCFNCKKLLNWDQRRFWESQEDKAVFFNCSCGFINPLPYLQFKWETLLEFENQGIKIK